eukprot:g8370.t1
MERLINFFVQKGCVTPILVCVVLSSAIATQPREVNTPLHPHRVNLYNAPLIGAKGRLTKQAKAFLDYVAIFITGEPLFSPEQSPREQLTRANDFAQRTFLRSTGKERWEMGGGQSHQVKLIANPELFLPTFGAFYMLLPVYPVQQECDALIIHGSTINNMRGRLAFATELLERGLRAKKIFFLTGARKLAKREHEAAQKLSRDLKEQGTEILPPKFEHQAAQMLVDLSPLKGQVEVIDGHIPEGRERPTTVTTVQTWLEHYSAKGQPLPRTIVAVSTNPFIIQQDADLRLVLMMAGHTDCQVETVGDSYALKAINAFYQAQPQEGKSLEASVINDSTQSLLVLFDTFGRALYGEFKMYEALHKDKKEKRPAQNKASRRG